MDISSTYVIRTCAITGALQQTSGSWKVWEGLIQWLDFFDLTQITQIESQTVICQYGFIPEANTCKILPTLDYEDRIWWLLLSFRSRMGVKQTSSHSSEVAEGLLCVGHPAAPWLVAGALDNLDHSEAWELPQCGTISWQKPSQAHEQLQHSLPCEHNPAQDVQCGPCQTLFPSFAEIQWTAVAARLTRGGSAHHGHNPWSRDNQHQEPALMTFHKSRYFQWADIWHWFINPAAGTILLSRVDKNLASPITDWFVSWEKIIYCFHIIASAILG